jgi:uncharacterized protein YndB with AHSA1/START domain
MSSADPGVTSYATPADNQVVVTRVLRASRDLAFDVFTSPRHLPNWMTGPEGWTMPVCEVDLRPGGTWHYVFRKSDGTETDMRGFSREVKRPELVVSTERWGPEWPETVNRIEFTERDGLTTMTMTMTYPSREARDAALRTGMKDGMETSYARMDRYLEQLAAK